MLGTSLRLFAKDGLSLGFHGAVLSLILFPFLGIAQEKEKACDSKKERERERERDQLCYIMKARQEEEGRDFINTTYDISLDSRTSRRCSKRILSASGILFLGHLLHEH